MKPGTRHRATLLAQALIDEEGEKIVRKVITAALNGDLAAAKLVLERLVPAVRERPVTVSVPADIRTAEDLNRAAGAILASACAGDILPGEAHALAGIIEIRRRTIETEELERRVSALEVRKT